MHCPAMHRQAGPTSIRLILRACSAVRLPAMPGKETPTAKLLAPRSTRSWMCGLAALLGAFFSGCLLDSQDSLWLQILR